MSVQSLTGVFDEVAPAGRTESAAALSGCLGVDVSVVVEERVRERLWGLHCRVVADAVQGGGGDVVSDLGHGVVGEVSGSGADSQHWHLQPALGGQLSNFVAFLEHGAI
jgi:hypothetical protein